MIDSSLRIYSRLIQITNQLDTMYANDKKISASDLSVISRLVSEIEIVLNGDRRNRK